MTFEQYMDTRRSHMRRRHVERQGLDFETAFRYVSLSMPIHERTSFIGFLELCNHGVIK